MINTLPQALIDLVTSIITESHNWSDRIGNAEIIDIPDGVSPKEMTKHINSSKDIYRPKYIKLYHGTHPQHPIESEGLKPTSANRRKSLQSSSGYVYLATTPEKAKMFGDLGNGINNSKVYEVIVPTHHILPDHDQLNNKRAAETEYGGDTKQEIGKSIGDSIVHGGTVRVKGAIPPWQIKEHTGQ